MENKKEEPDIFEKVFGEEPERGYEFRSVSFTIGSRAIVIGWSAKGIGFGELCLIFTENGLEVDTEMMNNDFVEAVLDEVITRIDGGQKARKWADISLWEKIKYASWKLIKKEIPYPEVMGYKEVQSKEGREDFIKSICLAFKYHILKYEVKKDHDN